MSLFTLSQSHISDNNLIFNLDNALETILKEFEDRPLF